MLRLTASDGDLSTSDDITITVQPRTSLPRSVPDQNQTIALPRTATLNGTVTDDGLPAGSTLSSLWSQVSGPGTTTFEDALLSETVASFSASGTYVLRLTATDSDLTASSEVTITVHPENHAPTANAGPDQTISLPAAAATQRLGRGRWLALRKQLECYLERGKWTGHSGVCESECHGDFRELQCRGHLCASPDGKRQRINNQRRRRHHSDTAKPGAGSKCRKQSDHHVTRRG